MAKLKSSTAKKNAYSRYETEGRAEKNKKAKIARHMKNHPNDAQSATRKPGASAGKAHEKRTPLEAAVIRVSNHELLFGREKGRIKGRDLSTKASREKFLASLKTEANKADKKAA